MEVLGHAVGDLIIAYLSASLAGVWCEEGLNALFIMYIIRGGVCMETVFIHSTFLNNEILNQLNVTTWEKVFRMMKSSAHEEIANKMINELSFNLYEWSRVYNGLERYFSKEKGFMTNEAKRLCDEIIKYFKDNNIPERDWLAIINQTDSEVRRLALNTPISKLIEIDQVNKKEQ